MTSGGGHPAERRRHPAAAFGVVLVTLWATVLLGLFGALAWSGLGGNTKVEPAGVTLIVLAALVLFGGLWWAWRVGSGGWGRRPPPPLPFGEPPPAPPPA